MASYFCCNIASEVDPTPDTRFRPNPSASLPPPQTRRHAQTYGPESLLRKEIDELRAGKHDHRLREVVATPLVDPSLHSVLVKTVDGGLGLPPAPSISDSEGEVESEGEDDGAANADDEGAADDGTTSGGEREADQGGVKEEQPKQQEVEISVVEDSGAGAAGRGKAPKKKQGNGELCLGDAVHRRSGSGLQDSSSTAAGSAETPTPAAARKSTSSKRGDRCPRSPAAAEQRTKSNGRVVAPDKSKTRAVENGRVLGDPGGAGCAGSHALPLRDRPPLLSGGGSRVPPAAPPPDRTPSTPSLSASPSSSNHGANGDRDSTRSDGRGRGSGGAGADCGSSSGAGGGGAAASAGGDLSRPKLAKKSGKGGGGGETNGQEKDSGSHGNATQVAAAESGGRSGRKRPRAEGDGNVEKAARDRKPKSREERPVGGKEGEDGGERGGGVTGREDSEAAKKERGESRDGEHFRRIALEVWDRVSFGCGTRVAFPGDSGRV